MLHQSPPTWLFFLADVTCIHPIFSAGIFCFRVKCDTLQQKKGLWMLLSKDFFQKHVQVYCIRSVLNRHLVQRLTMKSFLLAQITCPVDSFTGPTTNTQNTHTHTHSNTHTHTHSLTHSNTHTHTHTHTHKHTHSLTSHTLTLSPHTHTLSPTSHTQTHTHTHTRTRTHRHTYAHTHAHSPHTHTHRHTTF